MAKLYINSPDVTQLLRFAIGFDQVFDDLKRTTIGNTSNYPPYNIIKKSDTLYEIEMAVAGFGENELNVEIVSGELVVSGRSVTEESGEVEYLHQGIASRGFVRTFALADSVEVRAASVKNGILTIQLEHIVPDRDKPKQIAITFQP